MGETILNTILILGLCLFAATLGRNYGQKETIEYFETERAADRIKLENCLEVIKR